MRRYDLITYWPALLLVAVGSVCGKLLLRETGALLELQETVVREESLLTSPEVLQSSIVQYRKKMNRMHQLVDSMQSRLITFSNQGEVVEALTGEIRRFDISLIGLKPGEPELRPQFEVIPIQLQASGRFDSVCRLIYALESQGSSYRIRRFSQEVARGRRGVTNFDLELNIVIQKRRSDETTG